MLRFFRTVALYIFCQKPDCSLSYSGFYHMYDLGVSNTFHFHKKNTESSVLFLRNDALILNRKENKEASAICFWDKDSEEQ